MGSAAYYSHNDKTQAIESIDSISICLFWVLWIVFRSGLTTRRYILTEHLNRSLN